MSDDRAKGTEIAVLDRSRALVFFERRGKARQLVRAPSDFLTQLIACEQHLGSFRRARRADPRTGIACYDRNHPVPEPAFERHL